MKKWINVNVLNKRLGGPDAISRSSIYRLIREGHFLCFRAGSRLLIDADSVDDYIRRQISIFELENGLPDSE